MLPFREIFRDAASVAAHRIFFMCVVDGRTHVLYVSVYIAESAVGVGVSQRESIYLNRARLIAKYIYIYTNISGMCVYVCVPLRRGIGLWREEKKSREKKIKRW